MHSHYPLRNTKILAHLAAKDARRELGKREKLLSKLISESTTKSKLHMKLEILKMVQTE